MPRDEQGLEYSLYDPILFGPNYDPVTATTTGQRQYGSEYRGDIGSGFLRTFNEQNPFYGYDPRTATTAAQRIFGAGAGQGGEDGSPFQAFMADLLGNGEPGGAERALALLRQAGYSDTDIQAFRTNLLNNAGRTDKFSVLGDQLIPALALFGAAAGGAAAAGGFSGAEAGGAGVGATGVGTAGGATPLAGEAITSPLPVTFGPGVEGLTIGGGLGLTPAEAATLGAGEAGVLSGGAVGAVGGGTAGALTSGAGASSSAIPGTASETAPAVLSSGTTAAGGSTVPSATASSGLTLGNILRAAPAVASLASAVGSAAGGGGSGGNSNLDPETAALYQHLRELAAQSAPEYQANALGAANLLRQRASGSSAALLRQLAPQVRQIRERLAQAFTNLSSRLGPTGGTQEQRLQGEQVGQAGEALQKLFANAQGQAVQNNLSFLTNLRPALLASLPQLQQREIPFDYTKFGQGLASAATLGERLFPSTRTATTTGSAPTVAPNVYSAYDESSGLPLAAIGGGY